MKRLLLLALFLAVPLAGCEAPNAEGGGAAAPNSFDPPVGGAVVVQPSQPAALTDFNSIDEALSTLATATNDGDRKQQIAAYNWLCKQGEGGVPSLTAAVNDASLPIEARRLACGALGKLGPTAAAALIETSHHDEPLLRLKAIESMPAIEPPQKTIVQRLIVLVDDSDEKSQLAAIRALGSIGTAAGSAADKLIAMQNNPDLNELLRGEAARSLRLVKPRRTFED